MNISQTNMLAVKNELETAAVRCSKAAACIDDYIRAERQRAVESLTAAEPDGGPDPLKGYWTATSCLANDGTIAVDALAETHYAATPDWEAIAPDLITAANFIGSHGGDGLKSRDAARIARMLRGLAAFHQDRSAETNEASGDVQKPRQSAPDSRAHVRVDARALPLRDELQAILAVELNGNRPLESHVMFSRRNRIVDVILDRLIERFSLLGVDHRYLERIKAGTER